MSEGKKEILVVASKLKNHIKQNHQLSTSSKVPEALTGIISNACAKAAEAAQKAKRKTIMDRDFDFAQCSSANETEVLVVASKLKNHIKQNHQLSTSSKVPAALTGFIAKACAKAAEAAQKDRRKTIMDRDFEAFKSECCQGDSACM